MWIGVFLICVGFLVILSNMDIIRGDVWDYVWPIFFILLGVSMIFKRMRRNDDIERPDRTRQMDDNPKPPKEL